MPFLLSLIFHGLLLGVLSLCDFSTSEKKKVKNEIQYLELQGEAQISRPKMVKASKSERFSKASSKASPSQNSKNKKSKKRLDTEDLIPRTVDFQRMQHNQKAYNGSGTDPTAPDNSSDDWGAGGHQFGRLQDYGALKRVSQRIDQLVQYPEVLSTRKIGGFVKARLVLRKDGVCDWRASSIGGTRHELRVYVLMLLKDYCAKGPGRFTRESNNVDFSFQFDVYSKKKSFTLINGNVVLVHLPGHQDRGSWKLGPLQGHALFPTMVFLNPQWISENWNRLVHKKGALEELKQELSDPKF